MLEQIGKNQTVFPIYIISTLNDKISYYGISIYATNEKWTCIEIVAIVEFYLQL